MKKINLKIVSIYCFVMGWAFVFIGCISILIYEDMKIIRSLWFIKACFIIGSLFWLAFTLGIITNEYNKHLKHINN